MNSQVAPPTLSVVVNNYNYASYLPQALDSALSQMQAGDELIAVDDGSTDNSLALLERCRGEHGITVIAQRNQGQMAAVRRGIESAKADIVVLLDSDDLFLEGYLDRLRRIYSDQSHIDYVFAAPQCVGEKGAAENSVSRALQRLELPAGEVGSTRWATVMFQEYVGVPTSGNSMRRPLANAMLPYCESAAAPIRLSGLWARLLGVSATETQNPDYSADGMIVRWASILGAIKYYDARPGFLYRIHGSNKYARSTPAGRWYLRRMRAKGFAQLIRQKTAFAGAPQAADIRQEILERAFARSMTRRVILRGRYCRAIFSSAGTVGQKCSALAAALGFIRSGSRST